MKHDRNGYMEIGVIGSGSWATALVKLLSKNKTPVHWYMRRQADVDFVRTHKHNPGYLTGLQLDLDFVSPTTDLKNLLYRSETMFLAAPAAFMEAILKDVCAADLEKKTLVSAIKGLIPTSELLITEWLEENFEVENRRLAVVAGPCHAEEVALERQSYLTIAAPNLATGRAVAELLSCSYIKTNHSFDVYGIEYCAILKNVVAIACGICHGFGMGDNFQAVLVSMAIQEIKFFLDSLLPLESRNLFLSAYLGDLLVTCYSQFSRNRTFGNMLGRGYSVASAQMEMNMISEGYFAINSLYHRFPNIISQMPIVHMVYKILYIQADVGVEVKFIKKYLY